MIAAYKRWLLLILTLTFSLSFSPASEAAWLADMFQGATGIFSRNEGQSETVSQQLHELRVRARDIDPSVLQLALHAFQKARAKGLVRKPILTIIDFSKPATERRLWVLDLRNNNVPFYTLVAHGKNSGDNKTQFFSNTMGSKASSLGVFVTGDTYVGGNGYSLNLFGLERNFNDHAYQRRVVVHGAWYVSESLAKRYGRIGRSWGCPAIDENIAPSLINYIKKGSVVFAYYPDRTWLRRSQYVSDVTSSRWFV